MLLLFLSATNKRIAEIFIKTEMPAEFQKFRLTHGIGKNGVRRISVNGGWKHVAALFLPLLPGPPDTHQFPLYRVGILPEFSGSNDLRQSFGRTVIQCETVPILQTHAQGVRGKAEYRDRPDRGLQPCDLLFCSFVKRISVIKSVPFFVSDIPVDHSADHDARACGDPVKEEKAIGIVIRRKNQK